MKRVLIALAPLAAGAIAQEPSPEDMSAVSASYKALDAGRYLDAEAVLRERAFGPDGKPRPGFAYDRWAEKRGLLTGEPGPRAHPPGADPEPPDPAQLAALAGATTQDAVAAIVERARRTRLVILNEDHASPRDRAFGLQVARALRPLGYNVLGVETLNHHPDAAKAEKAMATLAREGYPHRTTGVYLRDPVFADFLRQSLALGYRPLAYEQTAYDQSGDMHARIARREQAQAENVARALKAYPSSKVMLYVGFNHATEQPQDMGGPEKARWLATRLKAMTGIDPLTIDQTTLNAYGAGNVRLYAAVADRVGGKPMVLFAGGRPLVVGQYAGLVDLQVAHPRTTRIGGRPDWLTTMGRTPTPIHATLLPRTGTRLVQAFVAGETDAIPVDQVLVSAGAPAPMLMLPSAPVHYAVQDAARRELSRLTRAGRRGG